MKESLKNILCFFFCLMLLLAISLLYGCMGTENYYNSQAAYYEAQAQANIAYVQAVSKPLAEMTAPDGTKFVVNNTNIQAPVIHTTENPIVAGLKTVVNSTPLAIITGGWAAKEVIKASTGNITNNGGTVTTNSNNQPQILNSDGNIDQSSHTATPTVVEKDKAIIVNQPEPVIVKPEIVTQPEPIIVNPEIVKPEVIETGVK